jgi:hypothetical protein
VTISFGLIYAIKTDMSHKELYHDVILSENILCQPEWKMFKISGLAKVERDRQVIGIQFDEPFRIDIDGDGGLVDSKGSGTEHRVRPAILRFVIDFTSRS